MEPFEIEIGRQVGRQYYFRPFTKLETVYRCKIVAVLDKTIIVEHYLHNEQRESGDDPVYRIQEIKPEQLLAPVPESPPKRRGWWDRFVDWLLRD